VCQRISKIAARNWLVILMSAIRGLLIRTPCGKFVGTAPDAWNERLFELPLICCVGLSGSGGIGNCEVVCVCAAVESGRTGKGFEAAKLAGLAINTMAIRVTQKAVKLEEIFRSMGSCSGISACCEFSRGEEH